MFIFKPWTLGNTSIQQLKLYSFVMSSIIIVTAMISFEWFDQRITFLFRDDDWWWLFAREVTHIGLFSNYFLAALFFLALSFYLIKLKKISNPKVINLFLKSKIMIYNLLFAGFWLHILKFIFGRQRPKISPDFDPHAFYPFNTNWDYHSLPSGHTQVLFCVATFFSHYYPKKKYLFYGVAFLFSFTRVMTRDHFFGDVLIGALVGHLSTIWLFFYLHKKSSLQF